jgi:hypothetical protein
MTRALGMHRQSPESSQLRVNTQQGRAVGGTKSTESSHVVGGFRPRLQPYWQRSRASLHEAYVNVFEALGCLYGAPYEEQEAAAIRAECEGHGLPMGYGRVHRAPTCLDAEQPQLFRNTQHQGWRWR